MSDGLTSDDPRYREMFDVRNEALSSAGHVEADLTPQMNALRDRAPVMKGSLGELLGLPGIHGQYDCEREHYSLLSWENCERAFRENLVFSSEVGLESPGVRAFGRSILVMIGEEHRNYRGLVQPMFLPAKVKSWWKPNLIVDAVDALVGRLDQWETADLNMELCARLPVHVVTRMIGLDSEDALTFRENLQASTIMSRHLPPDQVKAAADVVTRMLKDLVVKRRAEPGEDVISALAHNELKLPDGTSRLLTDEEVFGYCRLIMLAGGGTTWRQLGITLYALLDDHRNWEACLEQRDLIENAIEEAARWLPTDPTFPRLMTQDVEIDGVVVPQGARVDICVGSANRDPARWDNPDVFDLFRPYQYHIAFGLGPHRCLGMNVAKQEMISAINALMDRFPDLRLDRDAPPPQVMGGLHQRGMTHVPVRLR